MSRILALAALGIVLLLVLRADTAQPALVVPGNGAGYDPHAKVLAEIRDEVRGLRADLQRGPQALKPGADRKAAREQVLLRACAGCHTPGRADDGKDGGLILFADDASSALRPLDPRTAATVADWIKRGDMPPKKPLPPKERELFD